MGTSVIRVIDQIALMRPSDAKLRDCQRDKQNEQQ
jgi:hypothetical protein